MSTLLEIVKQAENSKEVGKKNGKWFPHASVEGGTKTIGYGRKLTSAEDKGNYIVLPNGSIHDFDTDGGLTDQEIQTILEDNLTKNRNLARVLFNKYAKGNEHKTVPTEFDKISPMYQDILIELSFNAGLMSKSGKKWGWPKLIDAILNNDIEKVKQEVSTKYTGTDGKAHVDTGRLRLRQQLIDNYQEAPLIDTGIPNLTQPIAQPTRQGLQPSQKAQETVSRQGGSVPHMPTLSQREQELRQSMAIDQTQQPMSLKQSEEQLALDAKQAMTKLLEDNPELRGGSTSSNSQKIEDYLYNKLSPYFEQQVTPQTPNETDASVSDQVSQLFN